MAFVHLGVLGSPWRSIRDHSSRGHGTINFYGYHNDRDREIHDHRFCYRLFPGESLDCLNRHFNVIVVDITCLSYLPKYLLPNFFSALNDLMSQY